MQHHKARFSIYQFVIPALIAMFFTLSNSSVVTIFAQSETEPEFPEPVACPMIIVMPYLDHVAVELGMSTAALSHLMANGQSVLTVITSANLDPEAIVAHYAKGLHDSLPMSLDGLCGLSIPSMIEYHTTEMQYFVFGERPIATTEPISTPDVTSTLEPTPITCPDLMPIDMWAASLLGMEWNELLEALESGMTVAMLAEARDVDPHWLVQEIIARETSIYEELAETGCSSQESVATYLAELPALVRHFVFGEVIVTPSPMPTPEPTSTPEPTPIACPDIIFLTHTEFVAEQLDLTTEELEAAMIVHGSAAAVVKANNVKPDTIIENYEKYLRHLLQGNIDSGCDSQEAIDGLIANWIAAMKSFLLEETGPVTPGSDTVDWFSTIGAVLEIDNNELLQAIVTALVNGQSIADIATSRGVAVDSIVKKILDAEYAVINEQVAQGVITLEYAQARMQVLPQVINELLTFSIQSVSNGSGNVDSISNDSVNNFFASGKEARIQTLVDAQNQTTVAIFLPMISTH